MRNDNISGWGIVRVVGSRINLSLSEMVKSNGLFVLYILLYPVANYF